MGTISDMKAEYRTFFVLPLQGNRDIIWTMQSVFVAW